MSLNDHSIEKLVEYIEDLWYDRKGESFKKRQNISIITGKGGAISFLCQIQTELNHDNIEAYRKDLEDNMMDGWYTIGILGVKYEHGPGSCFLSKDNKFWKYTFNNSGYVTNREEVKQIREK